MAQVTGTLYGLIKEMG